MTGEQSIMSNDLVIIVFSWLLLSLFGLASLPLIMLTIGRILPDKGWAFSRIIGWLMVAIPIWFLAHIGLPINTTPGIWLVLLGWLGLSAWLVYKYADSLIIQVKSIRHLIYIEEGLFLFGLVFLSLVRGFAPDINGLEKFMDAGLMVTYLNSPSLPIQDMWLAGETFNYYTFGHYLGAVASQVIRQPIEHSYNLILGFMMGLTLIQAFGLIIAWVSQVSKKIAWSTLLTGVLGALLVVFGGNVQHLWFLLTNKTFLGYWYPDATRFIPNTIHEFPAYSFIVSDLHAHVWSMVLVLLLLLFLWLFTRALFLPFMSMGSNLSSAPKQKKKLKKSDQTIGITTPELVCQLPLLDSPYVIAVPLGFLLGLITSTSTWDTLIYGLFLVILGVALLIYSRLKLLKTLLISAVIIAVSLAVAASPWWLSFESISEGARLVTERSEVWRFLALWSGHILVSGIALTTATWLLVKKVGRPHRYVFLIVLVATAWLLLILPEIFYMKDIYPSHPRANTMFKLTFQAFILMNLSAAWAIGTLVPNQTLPRVFRITAVSLIGLFALLTLIYPYFGYRDYYNRLSEYRGMDGLAFLARENPTDYEAIMWMRENIKGQPNIAEAVGESYTTFNRVSAFTGFPTILGWRVHEWLWRGSFDIPGTRTPEVETIFQLPTSYEAKQKLRQYNVEYIFVGDKEREAYANLDPVGLKSLGDVVFEAGDTFVIKLK